MEELLRIEDLSKEFVVKKSLLGKPLQTLKAVNHVNLTIRRGETLGIVGESGCGKTTLGRTLLQLETATSGHIYFDGVDLTTLSKEDMRQMRRRAQIIFQDPYASLNPRATVRELIRGPLDAFEIGTRQEREEEVERMTRRVGLDLEYLDRYPHEFSGGQRQRIVIARALILKPEFVVCDEPVSALDVSVRSQILNLLKELQEEMNLTCIFISHDLSVVKYVSNRLAVMYLGKIIELGDKKDIYDEPLHPYTQALMSAIPEPDVDHKRTRKALEGDVPSPINLPSGCVFHTRCPYAKESCSRVVPELQCIREERNHQCACTYAHIDSQYGDYI